MMSAPALSQLVNFSCPLHTDERLCLVCFEEDCSDKGLICVDCEFHNHKSHNTKSLTWILSQIQKDSDSSKKLIFYAAKIDIERDTAQSLINHIADEKAGVQLRKAIQIYFSAQSRQIELLRSAFRKIAELFYSKQEIKEYLANYKLHDRQSEQEKQMSNLQLFLKQSLASASERVKQLQSAVKEKLQINEMLEIFLSEGQKKLNYTFSQEFRHKTITVSDHIKVTQKNNYNTNFAVIEPIIEGSKKKCRGKRSVKIHIDRLTSWVSVGVGYLSVIKKANYYFNTGDVGHGGFLMSNNGYSWHHNDSSLNSYATGWEFFDGQTITVSVCPQKKLITFSKQGQNNYQLPFQPVSGDDLYFVVSLSSHDQSVSIEQ